MPQALKFQFIDDFDPSAAESLGVVEVPTGITSKPQLLQALRLAIPLPDYFGGNWDALDECLRDRLLKDPRRPLCLWHRDLPLVADAEDCRDYLALLNDTLNWAAARGAVDSGVDDSGVGMSGGNAQPSAKFKVLFPSSALRTIEQLVARNESS